MSSSMRNRTNRIVVAALMTLVAILVGACGSPAFSVGSAPTQNMIELTENMVRNAQYTLPDIGAFQLKAGSYEHKVGAGATQVTQVGFETAAFGDLNGDGAQDAAVVLHQQTGGTGTFVYLTASVNKNGIPEQAAVTRLGDRVKVKSLAVRDGQIVVDMLTFGPQDPMCCPSQLVTRTYGLDGQALTLTGNVTVSSPAATSIPTPVPPVSLTGTNWLLASLDGQPPLSGTSVTLSFENGKISGTDGCNRYSTSYTVEGAKFTAGKEVISTKMACPQPIMQQASAYVAALNRAAAYRSEGQQLTLVDSAGKAVATFTAHSGKLVGYKDIAYEIEGRAITLTNGVSEIEAASGSASTSVTRYFGNEATGDLNGDGTPDVAFLLTHSRGGSGTFYYVVAALKTKDGYVGTNAVLLGDRIAPQSTELRDGTVIVNYADRKPGEAMTTPPSVGVSKYLKVVDGKLVARAGAPPAAMGQPKPRELTLETPQNGARVSSSVEMRGRITVMPFEKNLVYRVYDASGARIAEGPITVQGEYGGPGTFATTIKLDTQARGALRIEVVDIHQADGSIIARTETSVVQ